MSHKPQYLEVFIQEAPSLSSQGWRLRWGFSRVSDQLQTPRRNKFRMVPAQNLPKKRIYIHILTYIYPPSDSPGCIGIAFSLSIFEPFFSQGVTWGPWVEIVGLLGGSKKGFRLLSDFKTQRRRTNERALCESHTYHIRGLLFPGVIFKLLSKSN